MRRIMGRCIVSRPGFEPGSAGPVERLKVHQVVGGSSRD